MDSQSVASRYTRALFDVAKETGLDSVRDELAEIGTLLRDTEAFAAFVENPAVPQEQQVSTLQALFDGKLSTLTMNFLLLLVRKRRLALLPAVLEGFGALVDEAQGVQSVDITSASPLTTEQLDALCEKLRQRSGKIIRPRLLVDESLLGGFRLRIGDQIQDFSIATKLAQFKQNVINA